MTSSIVTGWFTVTSGVGAGVEGAYVQMFASSALFVKWLFMGANHIASLISVADVEFDFATGAGGSEVDDYEDMLMRVTDLTNSTHNCQPWNWPVNIPAATRISVRVKDQDALARVYNVCVVLTDDSMPLGDPTSVLSIPFISLLSGAVMDGAWVQMSASLPNKVDYFMLGMCATATADEDGNFDIGTGPGGSEVVRLDEMPQARFKAIKHDLSTSWNGPISLDSGLRVAARIKDSHSSALNYLLGATFLTYP